MNNQKCNCCEYVVDAFGKKVKCKKTEENGKFVIWYYWNDGAPAECPLNTGTEEVGKMTSDERLEKLLNRFGQTISDLPTAELGIAYREYFLDDLINRMEIALQTASDRIDDIRETAVCMGENCRPYEDQRDAGFDDACMEIVNLIDSYSA